MIYNDYKFGEKGEFSIEKFRISFGLSNMDEEIEFPSRYIFEYKQSEADEKILITLDFSLAISNAFSLSRSFKSSLISFIFSSILILTSS